MSANRGVVIRVQGRRWRVDAPAVITIGRDPNAGIPVDASFVSRRHAEIHWDGSACVFVDTGSTNGSWLNGQRVARLAIRDVATIMLGHRSRGVAVTVEITAPREAPPVVPSGNTGATSTQSGDARRRSALAAFVAGIVLLGMFVVGWGPVAEVLGSPEDPVVSAPTTPSPSPGPTDPKTSPPVVPPTTAPTSPSPSVPATAAPSPIAEADVAAVFSPNQGSCIEIVRQEVVDCDQDVFQYKVVDVIDVGDPPEEPYPGTQTLKAWASKGCPDVGTWQLPTRKTWERFANDEILCLRFSPYHLAAGWEEAPHGCLNGDEDETLLVVGCRDRHDAQVLDVVPVGTPPGLQADVASRVAEDCPAATNGTFGPTAETWRQGFHLMLCLRTTNMPYAETVDKTIAALDAYWERALPRLGGGPYEPLQGGTRPYTFPDDSASCGEYQAGANNAFYCPRDDFVAWDDPYVRREFYDAHGDAAVAVVLAHEWGHAIQRRLGFMSLELDEHERAHLRLALEQSADCFAGAWFGAAFAGEFPDLQLSGTDRNEAVQAIVKVADPSFDHARVLQGDPHGDALERTGQFEHGYYGQSDLSVCLQPLSWLEAPRR